MTSPSNAPTREIGYAQASMMSASGGYSNWQMYEDETTPELRWPQSVYVYDAMRRTDAQVASVLRAVSLPVRRTPWRIDPAGARPEVVELVAEDLGLPIVGRDPKPLDRARDRFSWTDHLREALLMLPFGHSYFEQNVRIVNGQARLRKLALRAPKTIEEIEVARDGGLVSIKQYSVNSVTQPAIPVARLVAYIHDREAGNWLGSSLLRPAYKHWLIKDRLLRVQAQTIERNGMGIPVYTAAETEKDTTSGLGLATTLRSGEAAGAALPFGALLRLMGVEGTLPDAQPAIDYHDSQIARAVLAHFLNLGTQTGSWALGSTFADFFTLSLQTLAQQIADVATQHVVEDMVDWNFGENEPAPRIVFDEIGSRQQSTSEAIKSLVDAGVITPDEVLEGAVRQQFGLPPRDEATERTPPEPGPASGEPAQTQPDERPGSVAASAGDAGPKEVTAKYNPRQTRDGEGQWTDGTPGGGIDPLGVASSLVGGPDKFVGSARAGSDPDATGVNVVATEYSGDTSFTITTGPAAEAVQVDVYSDNFAILADEQIRKLAPKLNKAITAAENGKPFESKLDGEDNGDLIIGAKDGKVTVSARSWGWDEPEFEQEDLRPPLMSRDEFDETDWDMEYSYDEYLAEHAAGEFDDKLPEPTPPSWKTAELTVEQARDLLSDVKRLSDKPVTARGPRRRPTFKPGPKAVTAHQPGKHRQKDHGNDAGVDDAPLSAKLKGAGRIDLAPGERLLRSDRTKGENGRAWLAVTEKDGKRSLRIGLGNSQFGTRNDDNGPWRAAQDRSYEINEEREEIREEQELFTEQISELEDDPNADPAELDKLRKLRAELDDADTNEVTPNGHTAILDEQSAKQLRETLAKALDDGEKIQGELLGGPHHEEIARLEKQRDPLRRMGRKWTDEEDAEWDRLTAEIERLELLGAGVPEPERPARGFWVLAEGSIPGEWADVHYEVFLDDPSVGVETKLGAIPHHYDQDFDDLESSRANFDIVEADELVQLLTRMGFGNGSVNARAGSRSDRRVEAHRRGLRGKVRPKNRVRGGSRRVTAHTPSGHEHNQQSHAGGGVDLGAIALDGIKVYSPEGIQEIYGDIRDEEGVRLGDDDVYLTAKYFTSGDMHVSWDMPGGSSQVLEEMDPESMRQLADDIESVLDGFDEAEFDRDGYGPDDVVSDADSDKHGFYIYADRDGDVRIDPEGGGTSASAFDISAEQARDFVTALNNMADGYEDHFEYWDTGNVTAGARTRRPVRAHLKDLHDQKDHGRKGKKKAAPAVDAPATPKAKPSPAKKRAPAKKASPPVQKAPAAKPAKSGTASKAKSPRVDKSAPGSKSSPLADRIASGEKGSAEISDPDNSNKVYVIKFKDRSRAILKTTKTTEERAIPEFDAEELGAAVAQTLGLSAPEVHRSGPAEAYFAHVKDYAPQAVIGARALKRVDYESADALRIGLLDLLVGNIDRNNGNWFAENVGTPQERLIPIDHGLTFNESADRRDPKAAPFEHKAFNAPFVARELGGPSVWLDNPLSPAYMASLRPKLESLRPEFERLGRKGWHDWMLSRLDAVSEHAKGTVTL